MAHQSDLTRGPIPALIRQIAVPASVGLFFNTMYNVVDTWFAGLIGTEAQAALSLSLPVFFILISLGSGVQVGSTALIGAALGAKDHKKASTLAIQAISFGLALSVVLAVGGAFLAPRLFLLMGAADYVDTCMAYMTPIFTCAPAFLLLYMSNATLQATGDTRTIRNFLIGGAVLNCLLDPWFIYGGFGLPAMGVAGVAWATVLINAAGAVYLLSRARKTGLLHTDRGRNLIPRPQVYLDIARQGFPASLNYMTIGLGMFVINMFVSGFGQQAVAAYGVAMRVEQIALMPSIGLNVATLTITAQNYGAGNFDRIRETLRTALRFGAWLMIPAAVPVILLAEPFMQLFSRDAEVVRIGAQYLKIDALAFMGYVLIFVCTSTLQGLKRPMFAVWLGLFRQAAAPAMLFWASTELFGFGLPGIWWSIICIVWFSAAIAFVFSRQAIAQETTVYARKTSPEKA